MSDFFDCLINDPLFKRMEQMSLLNKGEEAKGDSYTLIEEKEYENGELANSYKRTRKVKDGKVIEDTIEKEPKPENKCSKKTKGSCYSYKEGDVKEKCTCNKENEGVKPITEKCSPNYDEILKYKKDIRELKMEIEVLRKNIENYKIVQEDIRKNTKRYLDFFKYFTIFPKEFNPNNSFFSATVPFSDKEYRKNKDSRIKDIFNGNKDGCLDLNKKITKEYNSNREDKFEKLVALIKELL